MILNILNILHVSAWYVQLGAGGASLVIRTIGVVILQYRYCDEICARTLRTLIGWYVEPVEDDSNEKDPMLGGEESPSAIMLTHSCGHAWIFLYSRWLMMARTKFNIHVIRQINCEHRFHTRTHGFNMFTCVFILRWQNEAGAGSM